MALPCVGDKKRTMRFLCRAVKTSAGANKKITLSIAQHSLQVQAPEAKTGPVFRSREESSLSISKGAVGGSLTVEAALAMSAFLFAVLGMLGLFFFIRTQIQVQNALEQTGNQLVTVPELASIPAAALVFQEKLEINKVDTSAVIGGRSGISLGRSSVMGQEPMVDLVAVYQMKIPFFIGSPKLIIVQRSRKHAFGKSTYLSSPEEKIVYVTDSGEVYHEDLYCTYICPRTERVSAKEIPDRRNGDGSIYNACQYCCEGNIADEVWITKWGEVYHQSEYCRGIWHDVKQIPLTEAWGMNACSKCGSTPER